MPTIVFLSDTHGYYSGLEIPAGDIIVHAGDFGHQGTLSELKQFHSWYASLPHQHKLFVAGNHDWCFEREPSEARAMLSGITYLQDQSVTFMGIKFYGSPWQPWFHDWAFNFPRGEKLAEVWAKVPEDTNVLVTHSPPHGILDLAKRGALCGCEELLKRVKVINPTYHLFGHIHECYGTQQVGFTTFVNGCICDIRYRPVNQAVTIYIESGKAKISVN